MCHLFPSVLLLLSLLRAQGDGSVVKRKVAHCQLKGLMLWGYSTKVLPVLSAVKDNRSITNLFVYGEPITTYSVHTSNYAVLYHMQDNVRMYEWLGPVHAQSHIGSTDLPLATFAPSNALIIIVYCVTFMHLRTC